MRPLHVYEEVDDAASRAVEAWNEGAPDPGVTAYILDLTSGENGVLSRTEWIELRERDVRVPKACHYGGTQWGRCLLQFEGRVVWEGEPQLIGLVEPGEPFRLRGLTLREWVQPREPPDTPPAEEMVGPLLVYRLMGAESGVGDAGSAPWYRRERVMVHDAGTGRSWRAYDWRVEFGERNPLSLRLARNGFLELEAGTVRFVSPDGEVRAVLLQDVLREREHIGAVDVSPDGGKVAIMLWKDEAPDGFIHPGEGYWPASHTLFVFDLPTGRTLIRGGVRFRVDGSRCRLGILHVLERGRDAARHCRARVRRYAVRRHRLDGAWRGPRSASGRDQVAAGLAKHPLRSPGDLLIREL